MISKDKKKKKKTFLEYLEDVDFKFYLSTRNWTLWSPEFREEETVSFDDYPCYNRKCNNYRYLDYDGEITEFCFVPEEYSICSLRRDNP